MNSNYFTRKQADMLKSDKIKNILQVVGVGGVDDCGGEGGGDDSGEDVQ